MAVEGWAEEGQQAGVTTRLSGHAGGLSVSVTEKVAPLVLLSPLSGAMGRRGGQDYTEGALTILLTLVDPNSQPTGWLR